MYIDILNVVSELESRRRDPGIMKKIMDFLEYLPPGLPKQPVACIPRHIATCTGEDIAFASMARSIGLVPFWPEYLSDRFTTANKGKVAYVRLKTRLPGGNRYATVVDSINTIDKAKQPLGEIVTNRRQADRHLLLPELHYQLRQIVFPDLAHNHFDISDWHKHQAVRFGAQGSEQRLAPFYYAATLAVYIGHAVMFEDYHNGPNAKNLARFRQTTLDPALEIIARHIGLAPLIVKLTYREDYDFYPRAVIDFLNG